MKDFGLEFKAFFLYFFILLAISLISYRKQKSEADYIIGNRSLNFWLTALSAHASDMSSWLFLGYPALIFMTGVEGAWAAIGLVVCMFLNWHFIAPKLRTVTEETKSLTLSTYFENRFKDTSGSIRVISAAMSVLFFTFYISSGLVGLGILVDSLFGLSYNLGIVIGLLVVVIYVFLGGYRTIAWIDLFQGIFLLIVIASIPIILIAKTGGLSPIMDAIKEQKLSTSLIPEWSINSIIANIMIALGWGLGYFGQPHILTKFMGIKKVSEMSKAKYLGVSWQTIALLSATFIGLIGIFMFPESHNPEHVVLDIVKTALLPFFAVLVLCAILAATTNVMAAQILVVASNLSEDFYKCLVRRQASSRELLWVSRTSVICVGVAALIIAFFKISSIYQLVLYSWSGLGASFGPLVLTSLYRSTINKYGAFAGILVGGLSSAIWPYYNQLYGWNIPPLIIGFCLSYLTIEIVSKITRTKK